MDLFSRGGSRGTSLSAIAERIGVTAPAITHHFGTKQQLLLEIVNELDRQDARELGGSSGSGTERLDDMREWTARILHDERDANLTRLRAVMAAEALDPEHSAHHRFIERHRRMRQTVADIIEAGQSDGTLRRDVEVDRTACEIVSVFQGAQFQWLLDPDRVDLKRVVDDYLDRLLVDLAP